MKKIEESIIDRHCRRALIESTRRHSETVDIKLASLAIERRAAMPPRELRTNLYFVGASYGPCGVCVLEMGFATPWAGNVRYHFISFVVEYA